MNVGSVGCLRNIENAIKVAQAVMNYTKHTLLVGDQGMSIIYVLACCHTNIIIKAFSC